MICDHCAAEVVVVSPGTEEVSTALGLILVDGVAIRCWCLECARQAGWPWLESEGRLTRRGAESQLARKTSQEGGNAPP